MTQVYLSRFYLAAQTFTVNVTAKSTTAGYYFGEGYSGESTNQLIEHVQDRIDDVYGSATVKLDKTTGKVTIDLGTTGSITWGTATTLRDLLGYTGDLSASQSYTATNQMRYAWVPLRSGAAVDASRYPNNRTAVEAWDYSSMSRVIRATDGTAYTVKAPLATGEAEISYDKLDLTSVRRSANPDPGTFEQLWIDSLSTGARVRVVLTVPGTATDPYTSANYVEAIFGEDGEIGRFGDYARRHIDDYNGLWDVDLPFVEYTA